jgi:hypothetical protein
VSPGEKGGVWIDPPFDNGWSAESGLGVLRDEPVAEPNCKSLELALVSWSSMVALRELRGVLGVNFVIVLLRLKPLPPDGSVKSAGVTLPIESVNGLVLGEYVSLSSALLSRALLLSLLRSLMPFIDESRLALARKNVLATSECDDDGVAELVISTGENVIELPVLVESVAESVSWPDVSIQPAGVGGTGPNEVPICGGSRALGRIPGAGICLENLSTAPVAL